MQNKLSILLLEDSLADARLIQEYLSEDKTASYEINHVMTLGESHDWLNNNPLPDLMLMDLNLPDSNGMDTFLSLSSFTNKFAIIILSGIEDQLIAIKALELGAQDYLDKSKLDGYWLNKSINYALQRHLQKKELQELTQRYEYAIVATNDGLYDWNIQTNELYISERWKEQLGYSNDELENTIDTWHSRLHPQEVQSLDKKLEEYLKNKRGYFNETFRLRHRDGHYIWLESKAKIVEFDENEEPLRMVGTHVDISKRVELELELKHKEELMIAQSRQAAMGDMIAMIAHQWRQPITVIAMAVNNLKVDIELEEEIASEQLVEMGDEILTQTQHLSKTIDDFRNFLKPNKEKTSVCVCDIVDGAVEMVEKSLENNNIKIDVVNHSKSKILLFANELLQVFLNIINNAKDALKSNKVKNAYVDIEVSEDDEYVRVQISDNGGGIPKEILKHLGEPYVSSRAASGTGLGVYMSKIIVEKHLLGKLEWENNEDGASFMIMLPLKDTRETR
ncbi:PAS domain-containing protein [Sulfurimonas aquatica]|uniref:histidine kinase n=1 Tax=Sulfurimonas aquatica TaxID=2672570 RepID=A0A975GCD9_9BACT|nr:PAS domain-containing protein [Sulfurimonas aquatica]QSZ41407.1 PAS domain-containing protein [Sulfurimonas aquatica]